jgi:hypothetical protein
MQKKYPATRKHNHVTRMIELLDCFSRMDLGPEPISFYAIHCKWCDIHTGKFCNCDPIVSTVPPGFFKLRDALLKHAQKARDV